MSDILDAGYEPGTQIDIVAHSMGGLITREMLRCYRNVLRSDDIDVGRVITIGTPHYGTYAATAPLPLALVYYIQNIIPQVSDWDTAVLRSFAPGSAFLTTLNANPSSYSYDIVWDTISGRNMNLGLVLMPFHVGYNDNIVAEWSAHLSLGTPHYMPDREHNQLITDPENSQSGESFTVVAGALGPEIDSDSDGLSDIEERFVYGTDEQDSDSDGDGILDGAEVAWGYDPLNVNSPIVASSLISSASVVGFSVTAYVNHYTAMDHVTFYARYQNSQGQWTGYYYKGIDYTPSSGKYSKYWTVSSVYVRMELKVYAYNSGSVNLGYDTQYFKLNGGGGPPIE